MFRSFVIILLAAAPAAHANLDACAQYLLARATAMPADATSEAEVKLMWQHYSLLLSDEIEGQQARNAEPTWPGPTRRAFKNFENAVCLSYETGGHQKAVALDSAEQARLAARVYRVRQALDGNAALGTVARHFRTHVEVLEFLAAPPQPNEFSASVPSVSDAENVYLWTALFGSVVGKFVMDRLGITDNFSPSIQAPVMGAGFASLMAWFARQPILVGKRPHVRRHYPLAPELRSYMQLEYFFASLDYNLVKHQTETFRVRHFGISVAPRTNVDFLVSTTKLPDGIEIRGSVVGWTGGFDEGKFVAGDDDPDRLEIDARPFQRPSVRSTRSPRRPVRR